MKEKIIMFVLGFLAGTIITTAIFLIARHNDMKHFKMVKGPQSMQMQERKEDNRRQEIQKNESQNKENLNKIPEQKADDSKADIK